MTTVRSRGRGWFAYAPVGSKTERYFDVEGTARLGCTVLGRLTSGSPCGEPLAVSVGAEGAHGSL
jgi:hypothetical protein